MDELCANDQQVLTSWRGMATLWAMGGGYSVLRNSAMAIASIASAHRGDHGQG